MAKNHYREGGRSVTPRRTWGGEFRRQLTTSRNPYRRDSDASRRFEKGRRDKLRKRSRSRWF